MRPNTGDFDHTRGVSEVVGFILILGIMMAGIAIITLYGYPLLLKEEANSNIRNMEKNMIVLQSDLNSLAFKSVPYQETTVQVSGGTLSIKQNPNTNKPYFEISDSGGVIEKFYPGELVFRSDNEGAFIVLENGAVHTHYFSDNTGSAMLAEPRWFYDNATKTYVINLINMNATENLARDGVVLLRMQITNESSYNRTISGDTYVKYVAEPSSNYNIAWKNYFDKPDLFMTDAGSGGFNSTYKLSPSANRLVVKRYNVTFLSFN
jgi:hypothetical protein